MKTKVMKVLSIRQGIEKCIAKWAMAKRNLFAHRSGLAMWAMWAHSLAKAEADFTKNVKSKAQSPKQKPTAIDASKNLNKSYHNFQALARHSCKL